MESAVNQSFVQKTSERTMKFLGTNPKDAKLSLTFFLLFHL